MAAVAPAINAIVHPAIDCAHSLIIVVGFITAIKLTFTGVHNKFKAQLTATDGCTADKVDSDRELCCMNYNFAHSVTSRKAKVKSLQNI